MTCPFSIRIADADLLLASTLAVAFPDGFPLSEGPTLVVPRRHEPDYFALGEDEKQAVWKLADDVRVHLAEPSAALEREAPPA